MIAHSLHRLVGRVDERANLPIAQSIAKTAGELDNCPQCSCTRRMILFVNSTSCWHKPRRCELLKLLASIFRKTAGRWFMQSIHALQF